MNKTIFARDREAVDQEIERLKPLMALGGYIPWSGSPHSAGAKFELCSTIVKRCRSSPLMQERQNTVSVGM